VQSGCAVFTVELDPWLTEIKDLGYTDIHLFQRDGKFGLPEEAPFTAIVATCGIEDVPAVWIEQLAEGGRLVAPVGDASCQRLTLFKKLRGELIPQRIGAYTRFQMLKEPPAPGKVKYACDQ
jgi:protein-L-isoaspartate(D-aspartate) O-methyltransferase